METHIFAWMMDIFFIFTLHILYSQLLGVKYKNRLILIAGWIGCFMLWNLGSYRFVSNNVFISNVITCLINFGALCFLYKGSIRTKIILVFTVVIIGIIAECTVGFLFVATETFAGNAFSFRMDDIYVVSALSKIICFIIIKFIAVISINHRQIKIKLADCLEIFSVPVGSIIICYMMWWNRKRYVDITQIVIIGVLLIINLTTYYVYQRIQANALERLNNELILQQNEYYRIRYEEFQSQWKKIRRLKHDMKNDYVLEMSYLEKGEYELLSRHYQGKLGKINNAEDVINSGNIGIDSIISYKIEQAKEFDIKIFRKIQIIDEVKINDVDLNILIGNLFDNAIEAVRKLEKEKRNIDILIKTDVTAFYLEINNSYDGNRQMDNDGNYLTVKGDRVNHGIGLKEVKELTQKYNGKFIIEDENQMFKVKILLYMQLDNNYR